MNVRRVGAMFIRIVSQFRRDKRTLALLFLAPLAIIALLGWVLSSSANTNVKLAVVNEARSTIVGAAAASRLETALAQQPNLAIDASLTDDSAVRQALKDKAIDMAIVIPPDFSLQNRTIQILTLGLNPSLPVRPAPSCRRSIGRRCTARRTPPSSTPWRRS